MHLLRDRLHGALAHEVGEFLDLHALLLDDPELLAGLDDMIRTGRYTADYALRLQRDRIAAVFSAMDDAYLRSRIDDIDQVVGRLHAALHKREADLQGIAGDILVTDTVAPTELAQLHAQGVLAVVTAGGSPLSHTAILARSLHVPLVIGAAQALQKINDGDVLAVDGGSGLVILEPNADDLREHQARVREYARERKQLHRLRREPTRTLDGVDVKLWANAESREDVAEAHALGAAGVGLYRTEFLFMHRPAELRRTLPDEEEQFRAYRDLVLGMTGRTVTIRTLDIGADKADESGLALTGEPNPALGLRGVRLSLSRIDLFRTQLRAILRATGYGPVRILVPMVSGREEMLAVRALVRDVQRELRAEGQAIADQVPVGAMIEVPSAAIALQTFIADTDFLSIGTNDLVQYLLAADRTNEALGELYSPLHPAVLRLLFEVIRAARTHKKPVAVCGEIAGDPLFAPVLLALGLEEFSLHPGTLLEVRRAIRALDLSALRARAAVLLRARDRAGIERWLARVAT
jgi:phosphotransferase system enzyme I (PtsI)